MVPAFLYKVSGPPAWAAGPHGDVWIVRRCWTAWLPRYRARTLPAAGASGRWGAALPILFPAVRLGRFLLLGTVYLGEWALCLLLFPLSFAVRVLAHRAWPVYVERLGRSPHVWTAQLPDARSAARAAACALDDVRNVGEPQRLWQDVRHP
jgi:hypothetical protein